MGSGCITKGYFVVFVYLPPVGESHAAYAVANIAKNTKAVFMFELILIVFVFVCLFFVVLFVCCSCSTCVTRCVRGVCTQKACESLSTIW